MFSNNPYRRSMRDIDAGAMSTLSAYIGGLVGLKYSDVESLSMDSLRDLQREEGMWVR